MHPCTPTLATWLPRKGKSGQSCFPENKQKNSLHFLQGRSEYGCASRQTSPRGCWCIWQPSLGRVFLDGSANGPIFTLVPDVFWHSLQVLSVYELKTWQPCWNICGLAPGVYAKNSHLLGGVNLNCLERHLNADNSHATVTFNGPDGCLQLQELQGSESFLTVSET